MAATLGMMPGTRIAGEGEFAGARLGVCRLAWDARND
jgi:hypothetical protein